MTVGGLGQACPGRTGVLRPQNIPAVTQKGRQTSPRMGMSSQAFSMEGGAGSAKSSEWVMERGQGEVRGSIPLHFVG